MERVDIMDSDAVISFGDAWEQAAGRVMQRMANRIAALEARAEAGSTDPCTCASDNGDGSAGFCGHCGGMRKPVAWWIGPHDGLVAGATTNKSLAVARIEHGATVRPLVFGDVAPSAEARVTDETVRRAESAYDAWVSQKDLFAEHTLCNPEAMRFALEAAHTGGASA
jgi:hypothetical protein